LGCISAIGFKLNLFQYKLHLTFRIVGPSQHTTSRYYYSMGAALAIA